MAHHPAPQDNTPAPSCDSDGCADAIVAVTIIAVVVATAAFWLHGMV